MTTAARGNGGAVNIHGGPDAGVGGSVSIVGGDVVHDQNERPGGDVLISGGESST